MVLLVVHPPLGYVVGGLMDSDITTINKVENSSHRQQRNERRNSATWHMNAQAFSIVNIIHCGLHNGLPYLTIVVPTWKLLLPRI